ncbi:hypothetical protein [Streptosporangium longisporum]|uniref:Histidine kinase n=1 Tax=Streptosporangium longisporum TaxID=46187 RepID=A0ABP6KYL9_9ACTN
MSHRSPAEITGLPLLIAWLEVVLMVGAIMSTPLLMRATTSWSALGGVMLLALFSLAVTVPLIMYAATRSPRPTALQLIAYGCAATTAIAVLVL